MHEEAEYASKDELLTMQEIVPFLKVPLSCVYWRLRGGRSTDPPLGYHIAKYWRFRAEEFRVAGSDTVSSKVLKNGRRRDVRFFSTSAPVGLQLMDNRPAIVPSPRNLRHPVESRHPQTGWKDRWRVWHRPRRTAWSRGRFPASCADRRSG